MPAPIRKIPKRGGSTGDRDRDDVARYFASCGLQHPPGKSAAAFLPFKSGEACRDDWATVRLQVRRSVSARVFAILSREFDDGAARVFDDWPRDELDALQRLTDDR